MSEHRQHLDDATLQSYLESDLDGEVRGAVESHLAICAGCAAKLEGWRMLLGELGELDTLHPSADFAPRVVARLRSTVPLIPPLWTRALAVLKRKPVGDPHPTADILQDLVDGRVHGRKAARFRSHIRACSACSSDHAEWTRLQARLDGLERLAPSSGFTDAVMSRVSGEEAPHHVPPLSERVLGAARALVPSTRRSWALASAFLISPAIGLATLGTLILLHPLLSLRGLLAFGVWWGSGLAQAGGSWLWETASQSSLAFRSYALIGAFSSSPGIALAVAFAIWSASVAAGWILFRNMLATTPSIASRHG